MEKAGKPDLVAKLLDIFLWVWVFIFGCAILPVGLGLIWLASGVLVAVFGYIDKVVIAIYELRFTYQFLFYGISIIFGTCFTIFQWRRRN